MGAAWGNPGLRFRRHSPPVEMWSSAVSTDVFRQPCRCLQPSFSVLGGLGIVFGAPLVLRRWEGQLLVGVASSRLHPVPTFS